ncbi:cytochrome P450 [Acrocarpospora pleiomorpha]|uniref:cytochrome P450 n=1 Tax=Acrocarpospora pleiomorpha TaxID=90975 RepID=UPI0012D304F4|nr:cytochrome P450 [Acrocarpospora pleiomorpha]
MRVDICCARYTLGYRRMRAEVTVSLAKGGIGDVVVDWESIDLGLTGPDYVTGDEQHEVFAFMRAEEPVHWTKGSHERGFWSLTRHEDCVAVLNSPGLFSSQAGSQLPPKGPTPTPEYLHKIGADVRLTHQDPPNHTQLRRPLNPHFSVPSSKKYRDGIEALVVKLIAGVNRPGEVDLVEDLCAPLPVNVFLRLMDVPEEKWDEVRELAKSIINPEDPVRAHGRDPRTVQADGFAALFEYMRADLMARRGASDTSFATTLANMRIDGEYLSERWVGWMGTTVTAAGLESTRDTAAVGLMEFIRHPDQAALLRNDPSLAPKAVEEVLRFVTPSKNRLRVATADTVIGDKQIKEGDWVVSWLTSANRDPEVFARPNEFDITRDPNPHLSFGLGTHMCLGRNVARIELELIFQKFLAAFPDAKELEPGPEWIISGQVVSGLKHYPVQLLADEPVGASA